MATMRSLFLLVPLATLAGCVVQGGADGQSSPHKTAKIGMPVYAPPTRQPPPAVGEGGAVDDGAGHTGATPSHGGRACSAAPRLLPTAVCVCGDVSHAGKLTVEAPAGGAANVGVEGDVGFAAGTSVDGSLWSRRGLHFAGDLSVRDNLWVRDEMSFAGSLKVGQNLAVGGDLSGAGDASVGSSLFVLGEASVAGDLTASRQEYIEPATSPCGCEGPGLFDVAGAVKAARERNDNGSLPTRADQVFVGATTLTLTEGRYFFENMTSVGQTKIVIEGQVHLFIDGSLDLVGKQQIELAPGATLDLYVNGSVATVGDVSFGDAARPEAFRLYLGGVGSALVGAGDRAFHGMIYAPTADLSFAGDTLIDGALYARSLSYAGDLRVRYARPTPSAGCPGG